MKLTSHSVSRSTVLAMAVMGVVLATALPSKACVFGDKMKSTEPGIMGDSSGSNGSTIGFNSPDSFKLAGAGLAALGLLAGGLFWKAQVGKQVTAASSLEVQEPQAAPKAASVFPIEVPAAALTDRAEAVKTGAE